MKGKISIVVGEIAEGRGKKPLQVALSDKTTAKDIINVILKKYNNEEDPFNFQLWEVSPTKQGPFICEECRAIVNLFV